LCPAMYILASLFIFLFLIQFRTTIKYLNKIMTLLYILYSKNQW
jgi:hypothetical protein